MRYLKTYVILLLAALTALPLAAVTDKEMEEAKAITAKTYLRWANNGSGYLDEISVKSMSELTGKLRQKEKENLKAFNSVKVPSDYAGWDKNKLIEFWAVTFFTSPALDAHGKGAKSTVRKKLSEMKISAPAKEEPKAETPEPEAKPETETESSAEAGAVSDGDAQLPDAMPDAMPDASQAAEQQEQLLNDQQAIEKDAAEAEESARPQEQAHTWVYVLVLAILVAVVIWLVVYAANLMKRQPSEGDKERRERRRRDDDDDDDLREQTRKAISKKNDELEDVRRRLGEEESKNADLGMELEKLKLQCKHLNENLEVLRDENRRLRLGRGAGTAEAVAAGTVRPHREVVRETVRETVREAQPETRRESVRGERVEKPREATRTRMAEEKPIIKVMYMGRANNRGIFVRADRRISEGNTIYRLDTNDGLVGTFHVVDEPEVVETALSNPAEYLGHGCTGEDLEDTAGVSRIITESAGTAIFENNYWKIIRKTRIRYE